MSLEPTSANQTFSQRASVVTEGARTVGIETDGRRANYLRVLNRGWLALGVVSLATIPVYPYWQLSLLIVCATSATFVLVGVLMRQAGIRRAAIAFCTCMNATFFAMFLTLAILLGPEEAFRTEATVLILMGVTALIAAALLGPRAALAVAAVNTVIVIGLRLAIAPESQPRPSLLVFYWLIAGIAFLYENTLNGVFAELRGVRDGLEATVADRTKELRASVERLQRVTDELSAANRDLDLFSAAVAHDLRNPLMVIEGYSRELERDTVHFGVDTTRSLQKMLAAEARMHRIIDGLLAFARLGQHAIQIERVSMSALAERLASECKTLEQERNVLIEVRSLPDCHADPVLIEQVLANLLTNAVKFTRPRDVAEIRISGEKENGELVYAVSDNGIGFKMQEADRLFNPLYRLHSQHEFEGSGIGLAAVERIVKLHGGRVWAQSEPELGATFFFSMPAAVVTSSQARTTTT